MKEVLLGLKQIVLEMASKDIGKFTFTEPEFAGGGGNKLSLLGRIYDGSVSMGLLLVVALGVALTATLAYSIVAKFKQCQKGQAEWSELIFLGLVEGLLMAVIAFLVTKSGLLLQGADIP